MKLKRVLMPMLVLGIIFGLSSVAHAQVTCSVDSTPVTRATATGHTEPTGDARVTCSAASAGTITTTTVLQLDYGVSITNSTSFPTGRPIALTGCTGVFTCGGNVTLIPGGTSRTAGSIQVQVPGPSVFAGPFPQTALFTVTGVLNSLAGTGKTSTLTTLTNATPGNGYLINGAADSSTMISTVLAGIKDPTINSVAGGTAVLAANGVSSDSTFAIDITENYVDMFRRETQFNGGFVNPTGAPGADTQLKLQFNNIPTGTFNINTCSATATKADTTASTLAPSLSATNVDSNIPFITINFDGDGDLSQVETVTFKCTGITPGNAVLTAGGAITVQVTLAPTGAALGALGALLSDATTGQVPRFASNLQPATGLTVVSIVPATTNLLASFAIAGGGFDTGIAISNTTADPFGTTTGGATPANGAITYTFFPNGGASFSFTTGAAGTPTGNGGLTSGVLNAGNTYSVLLSELLRAAGKGPAFNGYVFVTTNFTNAHGVAFAVSNFDGKFTSYVPLLVLPSPPAVGRTGGASGAEQLAQ